MPSGFFFNLDIITRLFFLMEREVLKWVSVFVPQFLWFH